MKLIDIIIVAVILAAVVIAIVAIKKNKKRGKSSCGCDCTSCPGCERKKQQIPRI